MLEAGIIGVGGYGRVHLVALSYCAAQGLGRLGAAVIREEDRPRHREEEAALQQAGVRLYRTAEAMLAAERGKLALVALPVGIADHADLSIAALEAGYHVLCEKPAAGTAAEALRMREASIRTGRYLAIGYQQIFTPSIQRLKKISLEKTLGRLLRARTYALWPRNNLYYQRNSWAGRIQVDGRRIYDSPIQNATAHFINNMLYLAGPAEGEAATICQVYGENYRAKAIEAADTQYLRIGCADGTVIRHIATHAVSRTVNPEIRLSYEHGLATWELDHNGLTKLYRRQPDGQYTQIDQFDSGALHPEQRVYVDTLQAIRDGRQPLANIHNAWQHVLCVEQSFASCRPVPVPAEYLEQLAEESGPGPEGPEAGAINVVIRGIEELIPRLSETEQSFAEYGVPWARAGQVVDLSSGDLSSH